MDSGDLILIGVAILLGFFLVFIITRAFWCWYWKISARLNEQRRTNEVLEGIYKALLQGNSLEAYNVSRPGDRPANNDGSFVNQTKHVNIPTGQQDNSLPKL